MTGYVRVSIVAAAIAVIFLSVVPHPIHAQPQWINTRGADGGIIYNIERDSTGRLLATTRHALFASQDNGSHWVRLVHSPPGADFSISSAYRTLAVTKQGTILAVAGAGILRIDMSGGSELLDPFDLPGHYAGTVSCILPTPDGTIYTILIPDDPSKLGLYRSIDDGRTWEHVSQGGSGLGANPSSLAVASSSVMVAGCTNGIYRSLDGGAHWSLAIATPYIVATYRTSIGTIFSADGNGMIYRSADEGVTWDSVKLEPKVTYVSEFITDLNGRIIVATRSGPFATTDDGRTWSKLSNNLIIGGLVIGTNGSILAATKDGVRDMGPLGSEWIFATDGLSAVEISTFYSGPNGREYAGTDASGLFTSSDGGRTWQRTSITGRRIMSVIETRNGSILAHVGDSVFDKSMIHRSTDGGITWDTIGGIGRYRTYTTLSQTMPDRIYLGSYFGIYLSTDDGLTWNILKESSGNINSMIVDSSGLIMAATATDLFRSFDDGATWDTVKQNVPIVQLMRDTHGILYAARDTGAPVRSTDFGSTWSALSSTGLPERPVVHTLVLTREGDLFAANQPLGIVRYVDDAAGWVPAENGIDNEFVTRLTETSEGALLAGTSVAGIYRSDAASIEVQEPAEADDRRGMAIFPNPASQLARILLPKSLRGIVSIELYDVRGTRIASLDGVNTAVEEDQLLINVGTLAPGRYVCRVYNANESLAHTLTIVR